MNRRALLKLAPALAVVPAAALSREILPPVSETPIMRAFREWDALYQSLNGEYGRSLSDDAFNAECARRIEMEDRAVTMAVEGPNDFAAKVLMLTNYGDHELPGPDYNPAFWSEARALVA